MKKTTLIAKLILFILTLVSFLGSAVFAWVAFVEKTQPIMLYSGRLIAEANLYQLIDPDYDGIDIDNEYTEITSAIHFQRVVPGQVFAFKLSVKNAGTVSAHLKVELALDAASHANLLSVMDIVFSDPLSVNEGLSNKTLFDTYELEKSETYDFYFNIVITQDVGNLFNNESVIIQNLIITLDQIQNL